ncbi:MAG: hypothetical protein GY750_02055 [Lentisphaerae bacterium]|nr:hypothetical protein [Lentisphaerota bacterium]MCP4100205.1 hypothetical protein [Lentisphaerota bacterium]
MRTMAKALLLAGILVTGSRLPAPNSNNGNNYSKAKAYYKYAADYAAKANKAAASGNNEQASAYKKCAECKKVMARYFEGKASRSAFDQAYKDYRNARETAAKYSNKSSSKTSKPCKKEYYVKYKTKSCNSDKNCYKKKTSVNDKFDKFSKKFTDSSLDGKTSSLKPPKSDNQRLASKFSKQSQALMYYSAKMKKSDKFQKAEYYKDLALARKKMATAFDSGDKSAMQKAVNEYSKVKSNYKNYFNKTLEKSHAANVKNVPQTKTIIPSSDSYKNALGDNKL